MLLLSSHIDRWLGNESTKPNIEMLTVLFFVLNVLAATQDIVVDGWALTMLKRYSFDRVTVLFKVEFFHYSYTFFFS